MYEKRTWRCGHCGTQDRWRGRIGEAGLSVATSSQRAAAVPSLRRSLIHWADGAADRADQQLSRLRANLIIRPRLLIPVVANIAVVGMVLALPFSAIGTSPIGNPPAAAYAAFDVAPRAQLTSRGLVMSDRSPVTVTAVEDQPIQRYTLSKDDTLATLANYYKISAEAIAFANGITDPTTLQIGREILIPPAEGALYTVKAGDTVEAVARRLKVDPAVIMSYNRLYFEPEHFAPGKVVFVASAELPGLVYQTVETVEEDVRPTFISRPAGPTQVTRTGRLAWPVGGRITQYYWGGHRGVDIAAPYGTGIAVPDAGTVISTGWVAVGGIHVRVRHDSGLVTGYYHMSAVYVAVGQRVPKGQVVGAIGLTGVTTGPHVHWECAIGGTLVDCFSQ
ncbi:MAG: M23 family metallopeptidase [Chloroflexi bacterium]|nr:M23 family metallopeptidase [Chloroflexota bacterium]